jgi:hypothetical protein
MELARLAAEARARAALLVEQARELLEAIATVHTDTLAIRREADEIRREALRLRGYEAE